MNNTANRTLASLMVLLAALLSGCLQPTKPTTSPSTTRPATVQTSAPTTTGSLKPTVSPTAAATTASPSTAVPTSPSTAATGTSAVPDLSYQVLAAGKSHQVDLNDDSVLESIYYTCPDDYSFNLVLNQTATHQAGEYFLSAWFFLIDLDNRDLLLDIAVQEEGSSDDYRVYFYYFDGKKLILRGIVPGMICDFFSETITTDPFGLGNIQLDGKGNLTTLTRGTVLHTWFFYESWSIGPDKLIQQVPQDYYPMWSYDPVTDEELPETAVKLKMDLPLLDEPGSSQILTTARSGQDAILVRTDNREWVQLRTAAGELGWFQLIDYFQVLVNGQPFYGDEVFEGLTFAD